MNMLHTASQSALRFAKRSVRFIAPALILFAFATSAVSHAADKPFLPPPPATVSTIPPNGDINPHGVAFVPDVLSQASFLHGDDLLVSNFNDVNNLQGKGTTIIRIDGNGKQSVFFQSAGNRSGLSAALGMLHDGTVIAGNLPTADGTSATAGPGALQIISPFGVLQSVIADQTIVNGPWGLAFNEDNAGAHVFITNVLNGTVTRLLLQRVGGSLTLAKSTVIASGLTHRGDPAALELGPSGLLYDAANDILYMASSTDNAIYKIANASTVDTNQALVLPVVQDAVHLHGPLDLGFTPTGHLLVADSDGSNVDPNQPSEIVEYTRDGTFVAQFSLDPNNGGAFGLAIQHIGRFSRLATVDDNASTVTIWTKLDQ